MATSTNPSRNQQTQLQPTSQTKPTRLPAPTLFVGPPSRNASQLSITRTNTHTSSPPSATTTTTTNNPLPSRLPHAPGGINIHTEKVVEETWKRVQATLNEVELVAQSSTHVFGQEHAERLDGLRAAQIELARAWGRSVSGDKEGEGMGVGGGGGKDGRGKGEIGGGGGGAGNVSVVSTALSDESVYDEGSEGDGDGEGGEVFEDAEEETAADIRLAGERRAANEAYFKKVDERVRDVVLKLEGVAEAMRSVEAESRSLWSSEESLESDVRDGRREKGKGK